MKRMVILVIAGMLVLLAACGGCTNKPQTPPATLPPTTFPPQTTLPPVTTAAPEPLRTLPSEQEVELELTKDRVYSDITLHYSGGRGLLFVQKIMMRVTRSDGTVEEQYMNDGKKPAQGDEIVIRGTRGQDRCEVYVTSAGTTYKVIDKPLLIGGFYDGS